MNGTTSEILDSLPYYDNELELDPTLQQKVDQAIKRELKTTEPLHPGVPPPFEIFVNNPSLKAELERVENHEPIPPLDTVRYQLPSPTSASATVEEWQAALKNAHSQIEHQRIRQNNIALMQAYGPNKWRVHNYLLEATAKGLEAALEEMKAKTTEVNRERKQSQTRIGTQLTSLETRWTELISNVIQIELANTALEAEIQVLNTRETELLGI